MGHRRRMRSKSLRATQADRELDQLKPIQDGKGFGLAQGGAALAAIVCQTLDEFIAKSTGYEMLTAA
jgi:hypothetical protein